MKVSRYYVHTDSLRLVVTMGSLSLALVLQLVEAASMVLFAALAPEIVLKLQHR